MRELSRSEREFKLLVRLFINEYFELDETCEKGFFCANSEIEYCYNLSDLYLYYDDITIKTIVKYMIINYDFLEKGFKRINVKGIDFSEKKKNQRILKNIKIKDGVIK